MPKGKKSAQEADRVDHALLAPITSKVLSGCTPIDTHPDYWEHASMELIQRDRILKKLIPQHTSTHLVSRGDPFVTLVRSIVGQQISVRASETVWERIVSACVELHPTQFVTVGAEHLAACGLSKRKVDYILGLAKYFIENTECVNEWPQMEDEAIIADLTQLSGIGRWTAEMFLIFNLRRPDILPLDDAGLKRAVSINYFSGEAVTRSDIREIAVNWAPWRTVATWHLWRSLDGAVQNY